MQFRSIAKMHHLGLAGLQILAARAELPTYIPLLECTSSGSLGELLKINRSSHYATHASKQRFGISRNR